MKQDNSSAMNAQLLLYSVSIWLGMILIAIINAVIREKTYRKIVSELAAHQISSILMSIFIMLMSYFFFLWVTVPYSTIDLWTIGSLWLLLTIGFEFIFGHFIMKHSWKRLLADYDISKGRLWILVLIASLTAPYITTSLL